MPETLLQEPPPETTHTAPPELERVLAMRRDELKPEVRTYADNLHEQILAIFREHGAKNYADFERIAREKELPMNLLEQIRSLVGKLLDVIEKNEFPWPSCNVTVDYDTPLAELIQEGKFELHGGENVTMKDGKRVRPINLTQEPSPAMGTGKREVHIVLFKPSRDFSTDWNDTVLLELDRRGFRPADIRETLALKVQHSDVLPNYIVVLGSIYKDQLGFSHVVESWGGKRFHMDMFEDAGGRGNEYFVPAVFKEQQ